MLGANKAVEHFGVPVDKLRCGLFDELAAHPVGRSIGLIVNDPDTLRGEDGHAECPGLGDLWDYHGIATPDQTAASGEAWTAYLDKNRDAFVQWEMDPAEAKREYSLPIRIRPTRIRAY